MSGSEFKPMIIDGVEITEEEAVRYLEETRDRGATTRAQDKEIIRRYRREAREKVQKALKEKEQADQAEFEILRRNELKARLAEIDSTSVTGILLAGHVITAADLPYNESVFLLVEKMGKPDAMLPQHFLQIMLELAQKEKKRQWANRHR